MDAAQKNKIEDMRLDGQSYAKIAGALGLSVNTVKSHCQRNRLGGKDCTAENIAACKNCGNHMVRNTGGRTRKFCSDACRMAWWKSHPECVGRKALYAIVCTHCGAEFFSYGNKGRKYCSHPCYIDARFGAAGKP
jgi:endogenous inhibitor of DNA gyrase (YacG/DUF329 family)